MWFLQGCFCFRTCGMIGSRPAHAWRLLAVLLPASHQWMTWHSVPDALLLIYWACPIRSECFASLPAALLAVTFLEHCTALPDRLAGVGNTTDPQQQLLPLCVRSCCLLAMSVSQGSWAPARQALQANFQAGSWQGAVKGILQEERCGAAAVDAAQQVLQQLAGMQPSQVCGASEIFGIACGVAVVRARAA